MSSKSAPNAPNYMGAAQQQTNANRPNQTNANGVSSTWGPNGQQTSFTGALGTANQSLQNQVAANANNPFSYNVGSGDQARQAATQASYANSAQYLDPQFAQAQAANTQQLANQGLDPSSAAAQTQTKNLALQKQQAYQSAMNNAQTAGTAAQQATFGENLAAGQFAKDEYGMPLQQLEQMNGLTGQAGFNQAGNYLQAAQDQGQYGLQAAQMNNQIMGELGQGLGSAASIAAMFYDGGIVGGADDDVVGGEPGEDYARGGKVPGRAFSFGDSPKNDRVPAYVSPGEVVVPRSVTKAPDAPRKAANFVADQLGKKKPFSF